MILRQKKNGDDRIHNTLYQTTEGIYNLKENLLYGETTQKITSDIKNIKDRHKDNKYKEEKNIALGSCIKIERVTVLIRTWMFHM